MITSLLIGFAGGALVWLIFYWLTPKPPYKHPWEIDQ